MGRFLLPAAAFMLIQYFVAEADVHLRRQKREWTVPPQKLEENVDYRNQEYIAIIRSDEEFKVPVQYSLKGVGATEDPKGLFIIDPVTGYIRITGILDREKIAMYNLSGVAKYTTGGFAENNLSLRIQVLDQNDCIPTFGEIAPGAINESSATGTYVMSIRARDDDEPGNPNSQIKYSIVSQSPGGPMMFGISDDGKLFVQNPADRETQSSYQLVIKGVDLNGAVNGNTGTGSVLVNILDINDNLPVLDKDSYEGSILENTANVEVMRFKAVDEDQENTDNWAAVYHIVSGNEAGYFTIETDPKTNEGVLKLVKSVDYEELKDIDIKVAVTNKAAYVISGGVFEWGMTGGGGISGTSSTSGKTYPVKINVLNQPEGPVFNPKVKAFPVSEDGMTFNPKNVIGRYAAIDGDTKQPATNVRYAKGSDPDNWLTIDEKTGEIRLNKAPDRESKYLTNGTYYAKILCMSQDMPSQTATGTVAIQVEDFNDHCPKLISTNQSTCTQDAAIFVTAVDKDDDPNGPPFTFQIVPDGTTGEWTVERINETTAILRPKKTLWPGSYKVALDIKDQQGHSCPNNEVLNVEACTCVDKQMCTGLEKTSKSSVLGPAGIGLLCLGLLMLLLIPLLLLFCNCGAGGAGGIGGIGGGFTDMPFDTKEHLISYHTEGQGEDKDVPLLNAPVEVDHRGKTNAALAAAGTIGTVGMGSGLALGSSGIRGGGHFQPGSHMERDFMSQEMYKDRESGNYAAFRGVESDMYDGIALHDAYLEDYYTQKASCLPENETLKENLLVYDDEGQGSVAGSVGCCSLLETDNDLEFLNNLDPKFKTLAEICGGPEVKPLVFSPQPLPKVEPPPPVTNVVTESTINVSNMVQPSTLVEKHIVTETSPVVPLPNVTVRENVVVPSSTYLIQQPMYYTTTPVLQPTRYVVEPQVHNTVLVSERPTAPNLQTMYVVNSVPSPENVVLTEKRVVAGPVGGTLVEGSGQVVREGLAGVKTGVGNLYGSQNLFVVDGQAGGTILQPGTLTRRDVSGTQNIILVEEQVGPGQVLHGAGTWVQQGSMQKAGGISGSQNILLVEKPGGSGQIMTGGTTTLIQGSDGKMGFSGGSTSGLPTLKKVITKEKKAI